MPNGFEPFIDFIEKNLEHVPSLLGRRKLKSWLPALKAIPAGRLTGVQRFAEELQYNVARQSTWPGKFNYAGSTLSNFVDWYSMGVPNIAQSDWQRLRYFLSDIRNQTYLQTLLELPAGFPEVPTWHMREARRFTEGQYEPVPWDTDFDPIPGHFVHFSRDSQGLIAYTQDAAKGERDIQTPLKPGKYLTKFYPDLHPDKVREYVAICDNANKLFLATTPEEIEHVYLNGPASCMSHPVAQYPNTNGLHPTRAYAGGDLAVAYIKDRAGTIKARTLVWPDKKKVGNLAYGDRDRMTAALKVAGYEIGRGDGSDLAGAKLKCYKFRPKSDPTRDYILFPYLDGAGITRIEFTENAEYMILGSKNGVDYARGQGGALRLPAFRTCPLMGKNYDLDKVVFVKLEDVDMEVARDEALKADRIFQCQRSQKYYSTATDHGKVAVSFNKSFGQHSYEVWKRDEIEKMAYECSVSKNVFSKQFMPPVILADGKKVSPSWFAQQTPMKAAA